MSIDLKNIRAVMRRITNFFQGIDGQLDQSTIDAECDPPIENRQENGDDLKDVYAQFGLTFSHACNVEAILANAILASDFVKNVITESRRAGKPIYTSNECARRFDDFLAKQHGQMMGELVRGVKGLIELDESLEKRVDDALRRRNYLAHNFWRERGGEVISRRRRNIVFKDLIADQRFFEKLAMDLENVATSEVGKLGLNAEKLRTRVDESVRKLQRELAR